MFKKLILTTVAVVIGLAVVKNWTKIRETVEDKIAAHEGKRPFETRIADLRKEIGKIDGELRKSVNNLIKLELDCSELREVATKLENNTSPMEKEARAKRDALKDATAETAVPVKNGSSKTLSVERAQRDLDSSVRRLKTTKDTLESVKARLAPKEESLAAAEERVNTIKEKREQLKSMVEKLESQLERLRLKQLVNNIDIDDSAVSKCESLYKEISRDLKEEDMKAIEYPKHGLSNGIEKVFKDEKAVSESLKAADEVLGDAEPKTVSKS